MIIHNLLAFWKATMLLVAIALAMVLSGCQREVPTPVTTPLDLSEWISQLETYGLAELLPPDRYSYNWLDAVFLKAIITKYEFSGDERYYTYIQQAVDNTLEKANGGNPNELAPALGISYMYGRTQDERYRVYMNKVWTDYQRIRRSAPGAVSHTYYDTQLWNDTIYMIGLFLQHAFLATSDNLYLEDYLKQLFLHADKLYDPEIGLWYHGWDDDGQNNSVVGSQPDWPDPTTGRSSEFWGRGNGWIIMSLVDALTIMDRQHPRYADVLTIYRTMVDALLPLQDQSSGHWFQLPIYTQDKDNYLESSCTAMYCYAIGRGIRLGLIDREKHFPVVERGVKGLQVHSTYTNNNNTSQPINVCVGTGIGNKGYYYDRSTVAGLSFAVGSYLLAGYELQQLTNP